MGQKSSVFVALLCNLLLGSALRDLSEIRFQFTTCGATGRNGPSISQCMAQYTEYNSSIIKNGGLIPLMSDGSQVFRGSQGFQIPISGLYNVTIGGASGGRGICSLNQGKGLLWKGTMELLDTQDLLVSVGQKGSEPCEVRKDIPVCKRPPASIAESSSCFTEWDNWLSSNSSLSSSSASTTLNYGGGGGGGGASMLRIRNRVTGEFNKLPVVIVGGGGGSAAMMSQDVLLQLNISELYTSFINAKNTDRDISLVNVHNYTGIRGYISSEVDIFNNRAGAGGGYFLAVSLQQDGASLNTSENFATGGFDCLHLNIDLSQRPLLETVHGGFGGGGGQCESGGSGGGYAGGSVFSNKYFGIPGNGGFYSFFSQPLNEVVQFSTELNPQLDGYVEIVPAECGCRFKCIVYEKEQKFECVCPSNTTLASDEFNCLEGLNINITELKQQYKVIDNFQITYLPFEKSIEIHSVYSTLILDLNESTGDSSLPFCTLVFLNETGNVNLATNTIRTRSGVVNQISPVNVSPLQLNDVLDDPYSVVGAVLISNQNCNISTYNMEFNISLDSMVFVAAPDVNAEDILEVVRNINDPAFSDKFPKINNGDTINVVLIASISAVGTLSALLAITILGLAYYFTHKRRTRTKPAAPVKNVYTSVIQDNSMVHNLLYNNHTPSHSSDNQSDPGLNLSRQERTYSTCSFSPNFGVTVPDHNYLTYNLQRGLSEGNVWEYSRSNLIYMKELGEGQFGKVLLMKSYGIAGFNGMIPVAVKTLSSTDPLIVIKFTEEANLMKQILHTNIVALLGVCFEDVDKDNAPLMILEYMPYGDLNSFLKKYRPGEVSDCQHGEIEIHHFRDFARDIADGLAFLSSRNYVHGDLASRNCLVGPALNIKIADFGLTKELANGATTYKIEGSAVLPLRWLSPESIVSGMFSLASDVWSFGVVLWEIISYGEVPLINLSNAEIIEMAEKRTLQHPRPSNCPNDIYDAITCCHRQSPQARSSIGEIRTLVHVHRE